MTIKCDENRIYISFISDRSANGYDYLSLTGDGIIPQITIQSRKEQVRITQPAREMSLPDRSSIENVTSVTLPDNARGNRGEHDGIL